MKTHLTLLCAAVLATVCACAPAPQDGEYGPYTVDTITDGVYHIQDYNASNPAGEAFDDQGNQTHFNNCSDMYLLVGKKEALLIDLSNRITWADNPEAALRELVYERTGDKPLTITFTHSHGDHTGMLPAFIDDPEVHFAMPRTDFASFRGQAPEDRTEFINEGYVFDLGGMSLEAVAVPGHTAGSMVYFLKGQNIVFTGDAIGSGHGVWIFDTDSFDRYYYGVPHLANYIADPANGIDADALQIYGGHYWQKDWLTLPEGREMGIGYINDMLELVEQVGLNKAAMEPSNLGRGDLDTYFRNGNAIIAWNAAQAAAYATRYTQPLVYHGEDLVIRQIDEHTWEGNGHHVSNETIYIIEGEEKTLVLDAGTSIKDYDKILAGITSKPIMLAATHVHGDHTGSAINYFPEIYINAADMVNVPSSMRNYEGEIKYLTDGQIIDLGGRQIEVIFTPGHTPGSTTFFDKEKGYGFSGDSFGSTYLLLGTNFSTLIATTSRIADYMQRNGIKFMYPGHYHGYNLETLQRVQDENKMAWEMLEGKREFNYDENARGNNSTIFDYDVTIAFRYPNAIK